MVIESKELEDKLDDVLEEFTRRLKPDEVIVEDKIALIAVVGRRMHRSIGVSGRICTALANKGINIKMLSQGTNEINVIVGVEAGDFEEAVRVLYAEFVR
jgi:aspartate kinase